jgi:hypothetical protein
MRNPNKTEEPTAFELEEIDAEPLDGSGFETEETDSDFDEPAEGRES